MLCELLYIICVISVGMLRMLLTRLVCQATFINVIYYVMRSAVLSV